MKIKAINYLRHTVIFLCLIFLLSSVLSAQDYKEEKEERIKKQEVPTEMLDILRSFLEGSRRIRFYRETDMEHLSYECKFKKDKKRYSIEFNNDGVFEDVELVIDKNEIPSDTKKGINTFLEKQYDRHTILRLQKQFSGKKEELTPVYIIQSALNGREENLIIRYELEIDGIQKGKLISHELLFDSAGHLLQQRIIKRRQTDNILY